jgi:6-phosphogluconate dehydrogenase
VKMVHNGIEYGLMASYAEGLNILRHGEGGTTGYRIDVAEVAEVWRRGSVVSSWLLDLAAQAFTAALFARFASRDEASFANRVLSAMRREFGGDVDD